MRALVVMSMLALANYAQAVSVGIVCDDTIKCTDANSHCFKRDVCTKGICVCDAGYAYRYTGTIGCVKEMLLEDTCTDYCTVGTCTSGKCQCASGQTASSDRRDCIRKALGGTCSVVTDCEGSRNGILSSTIACTDGKCQCRSGLKSLDTEVCIWDDDGAACTASNECFPGFAGTGAATCTSSKCECPTISGTKLIWKTVHAGFDRRVSICMNPSAQEVGVGQKCTNGVNDATTRFCGDGLTCGQCPENLGTTNFVCLPSGAGMVQVSLLLCALLGAVAALLH